MGVRKIKLDCISLPAWDWEDAAIIVLIETTSYVV